MRNAYNGGRPASEMKPPAKVPTGSIKKSTKKAILVDNFEEKFKDIEGQLEFDLWGNDE